MRSLQVITEPSFEPVTLAEAKLWCRVDDDITDQDAMILLLVKAMREHAETLTGRALVARTLELRLDEFPADGFIVLPSPPVTSITSVKYVDANGVLQSMDVSPTGWQEDLASAPARISPLTTTSWPATRGSELGAVRVRYQAGYTTPNAIPKSVRLWMQARIATLFDNREQLITGTIVAPIPRDFADGLLDGPNARTRFA